MSEWSNGCVNALVPSRVELFHIDALDFDLRSLYGTGPVKIIGNLPYYVSTPLIAKYTSALSPASMLVLTLQREVAERLVAMPRTKQFGAMTVCVSRRWNIRRAKTLPPSVFHPKPQVSSAVVIFDRKAARDIAPCDEVLFETLVRRGFAERRKQLRNLLAEHKEPLASPMCRSGREEKRSARRNSLSGNGRGLLSLCSPQRLSMARKCFASWMPRTASLALNRATRVHVNNLRHRAIHVLIFNRRGEVFLQKRSIWKDTHPGSGILPRPAMLMPEKATRSRLVANCARRSALIAPWKGSGNCQCSAATGWEFIEVFRGMHEGPFRFAAMEIETGAFFPLDQIRTWLERSPEDFSPVFAMCLGFVSKS